MTRSGSELIVLSLNAFGNDAVQDMVLNVEFNYDFKNSVVGEPIEEIKITFERICIVYKEYVDDERINNVEIPITFFTGAMIQYIEDCIVSNLKIEEPINLGDET